MIQPSETPVTIARHMLEGGGFIAITATANVPVAEVIGWVRILLELKEAELAKRVAEFNVDEAFARHLPTAPTPPVSGRAG